MLIIKRAVEQVKVQPHSNNTREDHPAKSEKSPGNRVARRDSGNWPNMGMLAVLYVFLSEYVFTFAEVN
jgi:hypothetical protein